MYTIMEANDTATHLYTIMEASDIATNLYTIVEASDMQIIVHHQCIEAYDVQNLIYFVHH